MSAAHTQSKIATVFQLDLFTPPPDQVVLCDQLGFHVWAMDGDNNCDCGQIVVGPWNCPESWIPGTPITTCWDIILFSSKVYNPNDPACAT